MGLKREQKIVRKLTLAMAISLALFNGRANALGLGNIELNSALNQPLDAEIELLSVREGETDGMIVTLASQEAFLRAGIDRPVALNQLRFNVAERNDGTPYIRVSSNSPVVEPFLNFLIEVDWPRGRLVREYTVLLDPPVFMTEQAQTSGVAAQSPATSVANAQVEGSLPAEIEREPVQQAIQPEVDRQPEPAPRPEPVAQPRAPVQLAAEPDLFPRIDPSAQPAPALDGSAPPSRPIASPDSGPAAAPVAGGGGQYGPVQAGQTLWNIANDTRPAGASVEQMMLALLRANRGAFINGNINLLRSGAILRVPDAGEVATLTREQALDQVREQNALWSAYRDTQPVATAPAADSPDAEREPGTAESAPPPADEAPPSDELRIVAEDDVARAVAEANAAKEAEAAALNAAEAARQELSLSEEQLESVRLERDELQSRVDDLEQTVSQMERLITLRENELAALQARLSQMEGGADSVADTTLAQVETDEPADQPAAGEDAAGTGQDSAALDGQTGTVEAPPQPEPVAEGEQQSVFERLLANPNLLLGGGAAAVLLLLLAFLMIRRRLADAEDDDLSVDDIAQAGHGERAEPIFEDDEFGTLGGEPARDTRPHAADEVIDEAPPTHVPAEEPVREKPPAAVDYDAMSELPKDDTIAEADVYLAYGLYGQAEDLLKLAIDENPSKPEYRLKLLEAYYSQKNAPAFIAAAGELHSRLDDSSQPIWNRAVAMGREIAPGESMFSAADGIDEAAVAAIQAGLGEGEGEDIATVSRGGDDLDRTQIIDETSLAEGAAGRDFEDDLEKTGTFAPMGRDVDELTTEFSAGDVELGIDDETLAAADAEIADIEAARAGGQDIDSDEDADDFAFNLDGEPEEISEDTMILGEDTSLGEEAESTASFQDDGDATMLLEDIDEDVTALLDEATSSEVLSAVDDDSQGDDTEFDLEREFGLSTAFDDDDGFDATSILDESRDDTGDSSSVADELENVDTSLLGESELDGVLDDTLHLDSELDGTVAEISDDTSGIDTGALEALNVGDGDEVDTMLDLARAYIDMGDSESAASALNEIISVGNDKQQQEARDLLEQIA